MKRKLVAVLKTYFVNPWLVFGALLYCVVAGFAVVAALNSVEPAKTESIFDSREDMTATLHHPKELIAWEANPARPKFYNGISIEPTADRGRTVKNAMHSNLESIEPAELELMEMDIQSLESLTRLTFLRTLELNGVKPTPELWQAIAELKELRRLTVRVPLKISLSDLPLLPNLEFLSASSIEPSELVTLKKQPRLRSIEVADADFIGPTEKTDSPSKLATLHELVELRELIINPRMSLSDKMPATTQVGSPLASLVPLPISPELGKEIRLLPNLRRIAIGKLGAKSVPRIHDVELEPVIAGCPKSIRVNSRVFGGNWIGFVDFMLSALLTAILKIQLLRQFSSPMSLLVPDYKRPHLLVPILFLFAHVALFSLLRIHVLEACLIPSVVESSCILLLFCVWTLVPNGRFTTPVLIIGMNLMPLLLPRITALYEHPSHRFFLLGDYLFLAIVILAGEIGLFWIVVKQTSNWPKALAFSNRLDRPFGSYFANEKSVLLSKYALPLRSKELYRAIASSKNGHEKSITRIWNAGIGHQTVRKFNWPLALGLFFSFVLLGSRTIRNAVEYSWLPVYVFAALLFGGIYSPLVRSLYYVDRMFAREPLFESESLLPLSKSMLRAIRMKGLWVEIGPSLMVFLSVSCAGTAARVLWPAWLKVPVDTIWLSCFHCLSSVVALWGLGLYLLTVRGSADRRIVAYPIVLSWAAGTICLAYYKVQAISLGAFGLEWIAVLCPCVVGMFLAYRAWVGLPQMETGRVN